MEQKAVISELIQGLEIARKLKEDLSSPSSSSVETRESLLQRILACYDKALLLLRWNESMSMDQPTKTSSPQPSVSLHKTPPLTHQQLKHNSKKRKMMPKWREQIRVQMEYGIEGSLGGDGYSWRKYGQKEILSAKYPRSYYRCTFRKTKGCLASKQVQRSEEDDTIFDITYRGSHTCKGNDAVLPQKSSQEQSLMTLKTDNITEPYPFFKTHQTSLLSPNTPESNYFVSPTFLVHGFDGVCSSDSQLPRIVSADTSSTTTSPIFDFNFSLDAVGIDENFPFNASHFLS